MSPATSGSTCAMPCRRHRCSRAGSSKSASALEAEPGPYVENHIEWLSRDSLRFALVLASRWSLGRHFEADRGYWIPLTAAIVLKPDFQTTFVRGFARIGGTLVGAVVATFVLTSVRGHEAAPGRRRYRSRGGRLPHLQSELRALYGCDHVVRRASCSACAVFPERRRSTREFSTRSRAAHSR